MTHAQVARYGPASVPFIGGLLGPLSRQLSPGLGDLVTHMMWQGSLGIILRLSPDETVVLWSVPPAPRWADEDEATDPRETCDEASDLRDHG